MRRKIFSAWGSIPEDWAWLQSIHPGKVSIIKINNETERPTNPYM
jgi:hypothetical protein